MTKEEFINEAIEYRKKGKNNAYRFVCQKIENCEECPIVNYSKDGITATCHVEDALIDEIIRLREEKLERKETNLERYFRHTTFKMTRDKVVLESDYAGDGVEDVFMKINGNTVQWLLSPYEPPKRYQMSQLCYDIIKRYVGTCANPNVTLKNAALSDVLYLLDFYEESWKDIRLEDLLENAEVVEE